MNLGLLLVTGFLTFSDYACVFQGDTSIDAMENSTSYPVVSMEQIYDMNESFLAGEQVEPDFLPDNSIRVVNNIGWDVQVLDETGYTDYICTWIRYGSSDELDVPVMVHQLTLEEISLDASKEEFEAFVEKTRESGLKIREDIQYIKDTCDGDAYGGVFYDWEKEAVCVYVKDDTLRKTLENKGYVCLNAEYSLNELYEELREIWAQRTELGINYIEVDQTEQKLIIYTDDKETMSDRMELQGIDNGEVFQCVLMHPWDCHYNELSQSGELEKQSERIFDYLEGCDDETETKIGVGLKVLREVYPEYEARNLLLRIAADGNYERYLDFDKALLAFVDTLPAYIPNEQNPAEELLFGDPERLELKSQLREYKLIYPEMSYEEIYDKYLSDWENDIVETRIKKQYQLVVERSVGELKDAESLLKKQELDNVPKNEQNLEEKKMFAPYVVMFGVVVMLLASVTFHYKGAVKK